MNREITLAGADNFRDVGGCQTTDGRRVRWRRLFRSASLQELTDEDLVVLRDDLDIATVIDLRARSEAEREGIGRIGALGRAHQFIPIVREHADYTYHVPSRIDLDAQYFEIVLDAGDAVIDIVRLLADGRATPAILHCAAGKDRTGIVTSLVLSLLGVVRDQIVADYARSGMHMDAVVGRLRQLPSYGARVDLVPAGVWSADPAHAEGLLHRIDDGFGSVRAWAASLGLEDETVTALQSHLLEDADAPLAVTPGRDGPSAAGCPTG